MGSATFIINGVKDTKNDKGKDKPSDNESGDSHDYLFIPRMASEPLNDSFHKGIYSLSGLLEATIELRSCEEIKQTEKSLM